MSRMAWEVRLITAPARSQIFKELRGEAPHYKWDNTSVFLICQGISLPTGQSFLTHIASTSTVALRYVE